jgi:hypothetical protein
LVPSVSALEVRHYKSLQKQFVEQRWTQQKAVPLCVSFILFGFAIWIAFDWMHGCAHYHFYSSSFFLIIQLIITWIILF